MKQHSNANDEQIDPVIDRGLLADVGHKSHVPEFQTGHERLLISWGKTLKCLFFYKQYISLCNIEVLPTLTALFIF